MRARALPRGRGATPASAAGRWRLQFGGARVNWRLEQAEGIAVHAGEVPTCGDSARIRFPRSWWTRHAVRSAALDPRKVESDLFAHHFSAACHLLAAAHQDGGSQHDAADLSRITSIHDRGRQHALPRLDPAPVLAFISLGCAVAQWARLRLAGPPHPGLEPGLASSLTVRAFFSPRPSCWGTAKCIRHAGRDVSSRMDHFIVKP